MLHQNRRPYTAVFRSDGRGTIERVTPDDALAAADAAAKVSKDEPVLVCGDGAEIFFAALNNENHPNAFLAPENTRFQSAAGVALAAEGMEGVSPEELLPVYLRKSQAEREREARLAAMNEGEGK